jgi:hypothetical protein
MCYVRVGFVALLISLAATTVGGQARPLDERQPAAAPADDVAVALRSVLDRGGLRLSTAEPSASPVFSFSLWLAPAERGDDRTAGTELVFRGDHGTATVVSRSAGGLPFAYATSGAYLQLDPAVPGRLTTAGRGELDVQFGSSADGLSFRFRYGPEVRQTELTLDLESILRGMLGAAHPLGRDPKSGALLFQTKNRVVAVRMNGDKGGGYPIRDVLMLTPDGRRLTLSISDIRTAGAATGIAADALAQERIKATGLPLVEQPGNATRDQFPIPPAKFWDAEANRAAARQLAAVIGPPLPATRPSTTLPATTGPIGDAGPSAADGMSEAIEIRSATVEVLDALQRSVQSAGLSRDQQNLIDQLFARRRDEFVKQVEELMAGRDGDRAGAWAYAMQAVDIAESLAQTLSDDQLGIVARAWAKDRAEEELPPAFRELISTLVAAADRVRMSPHQRFQLSQALATTTAEFRRERASLQAGTIDPVTARRHGDAISRRLNDHIRTMLTPEQYRELEQVAGEIVQGGRK